MAIKRDAPYDWKKVELEEIVNVPNMHPHPLKKFRTKDQTEVEELKKEAQKEKKKETYKDQDGNEYEYDDEIPECYWLCNGAEENTGLVDGCKSK